MHRRIGIILPVVMLFFYVLLLTGGCELFFEDINGGHNGSDDDTGTVIDVEQMSHTVNDVQFYMRLAPASTFPTGTDDSGEATIDQDFWVAETQVTYELWYEVRMWALDNGYNFANEGSEGSHGDIGKMPSSRQNEPVARVNWYSSVVWCNALSEFKGYDPVYMVDGAVMKDAIGTSHTEVIANDANGFRLPTSMEWELAARYKGSDSSHGAIEYPLGSGMFWTPGNYASGATGPAYNPFNEEATKAAAWYWGNCNVDGAGHKTQPVGQKPRNGNGLGVFDMSGNLFEWCFTVRGSHQIIRGGSWFGSSHPLQIGYDGCVMPFDSANFRGFRFVRTHF